ncbi:hypothetical protein KIPB_016108, partial [Kipferlia bialata]
EKLAMAEALLAEAGYEKSPEKKEEQTTGKSLAQIRRQRRKAKKAEKEREEREERNAELKEKRLLREAAEREVRRYHIIYV